MRGGAEGGGKGGFEEDSIASTSTGGVFDGEIRILEGARRKRKDMDGGGLRKCGY